MGYGLITAIVVVARAISVSTPCSSSQNTSASQKWIDLPGFTTRPTARRRRPSPLVK